MKRLLALAFLVVCSPAFADLAHRKSAVVEVVQKVSPAVVAIGTEQVVEQRFRGGREAFFDELFGIERKPQMIQGLGSGAIIDASGIIVTNDHVIRGATAIHVILADGRQLEAEVIGSDADNDLAVLRVQSKAALPTAKLGTSSDLMIGETVVAIGAPFGLSKTVTVGVVSAVGRSFKAEDKVFNDFVQTDASINPGNSGGPLLNVDGEIIGINTAIFSSAQGIGFAIPADKVRRIVQELTQFGKVRPAWVGIDVEPLSRKVANQLGWDRNYGAVVSKVDPGSPAEKAGVQPGDIVAELGGSRVEDADDFRERLRGYPAGSSFTVTVSRGNETKQLNLSPVEFPPKLVDSLAWDKLGIKVKEANGALQISGVHPGSPAERVGLSVGDFLLKLNNQPMKNVSVFREALLAARTSRSVLLVIQRGRFGYYVTLPF